MAKKSFFYAIYFIVALASLQLSDLVVIKYFVYSLNQKLFFGLILNNAWSLVLSLAILVLASLYLLKNKNLLFCFVFFSAGLISNLLDRIFRGGVVDYLNFFGLFYFNLADVLIVAVLVFAGYKIIFPTKNFNRD